MLAAFQSYTARTLLVLDLIGTFVFALSGAVAGVRERLDLFGVLGRSKGSLASLFLLLDDGLVDPINS